MREFILYPAIDVLGGRCVRLRQGDYAQAQVFDEDPVAVARRWQAAGATWLHVVDLDGALHGTPAHVEVARRIAAETGLPVQFGGGMRTEEDVAAALEQGVSRVILGTVAERRQDVLERCLDRWGEQIAVSVDVRGEGVAVAGWLELVSESAAGFAARMAALGVRTLVVTDTERDGTLEGTETTRLEALRAALPEVRLIAAGGLASLDDLRNLARVGMEGVVVGRALYEGTVDLAEALAVARAATTEGADAW